MAINLKSLVVILIALLMGGCNLIAKSQLNASNPQIVSSKDVPRLINGLPSYAKFSYSGLSFFNGKLYASSNIGLLEYEGGTLSRLYTWYEKDDVISGPWVDRANQSLWVFHNGINKLIRFDGKKWSTVDLPRSKEGFSRGDMLRGFQGVSTDSAFRLQGGDYAWRWDANKSAWIVEPVPDTGLFVSIVPVKDRVFIIMQHLYTPYFAESPNNRPDKPNTEAVYFSQNGQWQELPNKSGNFFTENIVIAKETAYILTKDGRLLRVTTSDVSPIESLGEVESMTTTSSGNLLVSFRNNGIYEYANGWHKRFACPYPLTEPTHWAYLSENNGQVALAVTSKSQGAGKNAGLTALWISSGSELKAVPLGGR
jgi:hypothetical protein